MIFRPAIFLPCLLCTCFALSSLAQRGKKDKIKDEELIQYKHNFHEGLRNKLKGNQQLAMEHFNEALKYKPEDGATHYALAELLSNMDQLQMAMEHAERAVESSPENTWYLRMQGVLQRSTGKLTEAKRTFQTLTELAPKDLQVKEYLIDIALNLGEEKLALEVLQQMEDEIGPTPALMVEIYKLQMRAGKTIEAQNTLERALEADPSNMALIGMLIEHFKQLDRPEMAKVWLEKSLENDPNNGILRLALAEMELTDSSDPGAFTDHLFVAFKDQNVDAGTKVALVIDHLFSKVEKDAQARKTAMDLAKVITEAHPNEARAHSLLGDLHLIDQDPKNALASFQKALNLDKARLPIWTATLSLEATLQQYDSLRVHGLEATETYPTQPMLYLYAGIGLMHTGDMERAEELLESGLMLVIDDPNLKVEFLQVMGQLSFKQKNYTNGKSLFDEAMTLSGNHPMVMNNFAYQLAEHDHDLKKAEKLILNAIELRPDQANMEDTYGWILFKKGKYQEAESWLRKALEHDTQNGEVYEHLGDLLLKTGRKSEAIEQWQLAKTHGGHSPDLDTKLKEANP